MCYFFFLFYMLFACRLPLIWNSNISMQIRYVPPELWYLLNYVFEMKKVFFLFWKDWWYAKNIQFTIPRESVNYNETLPKIKKEENCTSHGMGEMIFFFFFFFFFPSVDSADAERLEQVLEVQNIRGNKDRTEICLEAVTVLRSNWPGVRSKSMPTVGSGWKWGKNFGNHSNDRIEIEINIRLFNMAAVYGS